MNPVVRDSVTYRDEHGNIVATEEVSQYVIHNEQTPPLHFDPESPHTQFVLYLWSKKIRNRRRYMRNIIHRARQKMIDELILEEVE